MYIYTLEKPTVVHQLPIDLSNFLGKYSNGKLQRKKPAGSSMSTMCM